MCAKIGARTQPCAEFDDYVKKPENKGRDVSMASSEWSCEHASDQLSNFKATIVCSFCPMCSQQPSKKINATAVTNSIEERTSNLIGKFELYDLESKLINEWCKTKYDPTDVESGTETDSIKQAPTRELAFRHKQDNEVDDKRSDSPVNA